MIFPVMMEGGLTRPEGGGIAQILKVRLIHATIRQLLLRGRPEDAAAVVGERRRQADVHVLPPLAARETRKAMHHALFAHGWNVGRDGLPCNQEELGYTLLTFHYVVLRGLRRLGLGPAARRRGGVPARLERDGSRAGIREDLMAHTMADAQALFARMQARGRADPLAPDPRPLLGRALMRSMETLIPLRVAKPIPTLPHAPPVRTGHRARHRHRRPRVVAVPRAVSRCVRASCAPSTAPCGWWCATSRSRASSPA
jgi:hypothetical protein